ncbi:lipoprotein [Longispora fulva]|uniref:DUF4349 domain-containing protein n=1 Tax=Longispora fulva TaxID=619741 RepID=A0A8J7GJ96_9ACTN|nr:DUF4349 domain-containing protein [Longispora fulva]MBG6140334.1 hypothetical protein [Longispora fulva]GIG57285.1 lipoprotein [Longispora fulva]
MRTKWIVIPLLAVALTGCSSASSTSDHGVEAPAAGPHAAAPPAKDAAPPVNGAPAPADVTTRSIIYTGTMTLTVPSMETAAGDAAAIAERARGFVGGEQRGTGHGAPTATLTLRVPSAAFYATVTEIAKLGKEESREIKTEDVTTAVVDVDARIIAQRASVARIRGLLDKASGLAEITSIEAELAKREGELASLEARKRTLDDQVTLSTITVKLIGPAPVVAEKPKKEPETGFLAGLRSGWKGFTAVLNAAATVFGALLPFLVVLAVPVVGLLWWRRRSRGLSAATSPAAPPPSTGLTAPPAPAGRSAD